MQTFGHRGEMKMAICTNCKKTLQENESEFCKECTDIFEAQQAEQEAENQAKYEAEQAAEADEAYDDALAEKYHAEGC
mgnify:CR=1 FL=1